MAGILVMKVKIQKRSSHWPFREGIYQLWVTITMLLIWSGHESQEFCNRRWIKTFKLLSHATHILQHNRSILLLFSLSDDNSHEILPLVQDAWPSASTTSYTLKHARSCKQVLGYRLFELPRLKYIRNKVPIIKKAPILTAKTIHRCIRSVRLTKSCTSRSQLKTTGVLSYQRGKMLT